tara:strand:- start:2706 stop:4349 length:1644 start_codon:yes stop_codon:yes gene_type:complete
MNMKAIDDQLILELQRSLTAIISETNGISLNDTMELLENAETVKTKPHLMAQIKSFKTLLNHFDQDEVQIDSLLNHPISEALFLFFKNFPLPYREEHIHLTGSLSADFIFPRIKKLLNGKNKAIYEKIISDTYGEDFIPIETVEQVDHMIRLKEGEFFEQYLKILLLPKLILTSRKVHEEAAYHMAKELKTKYNVGFIRLKFTLSRVTSMEGEQIPGAGKLTEEDVVLGLYDGFKKFQQEEPDFDFILAPSFRKEPNFYDKQNYQSKEEHFISQVESLLKILEKHPKLRKVVCEVDTVGNEKDLYRKSHFNEMKYGFRKLQFKGFKIRSHHGEVWYTLRKGIQAVDNAMNIWHIDTLEHGLSLGINPNYYFHSLYQRVLQNNLKHLPLKEGSIEYYEILDMDWTRNPTVKEKILTGEPLSMEERIIFVKTKFHTAREVEHYQHDVLNRMIQKQVSLTALPSSNTKLTRYFKDYKDHPFDWWEKKGVSLGVGTDNYITLNTNYIQEMLILLYTDPNNLKITKLLMVTSGQRHRPYISQLLWSMRNNQK